MTIHFSFFNPLDKEWKNLANEIATVSWKAGKSLSNKMLVKDFFDWETILIGLNDDNTIACFCGITKTDTLIDESITPFIGYVFVDEQFRGKRLSEEMMIYAEKYLNNLGFTSVYVVSGEIGLYEKYGYKKVKKAITKQGDVESLYRKYLTGGYDK